MLEGFTIVQSSGLKKYFPNVTLFAISPDSQQDN